MGKLFKKFKDIGKGVVERGKATYRRRAEERAKLKEIYTTTMHKERKKLAKEKDEIRVEEQIEKAKERARNPLLKKVARGIGKATVSGIKAIQKMDAGKTPRARGRKSREYIDSDIGGGFGGIGLNLPKEGKGKKKETVWF